MNNGFDQRFPRSYSLIIFGNKQGVELLAKAVGGKLCPQFEWDCTLSPQTFANGSVE